MLKFILPMCLITMLAALEPAKASATRLDIALPEEGYPPYVVVEKNKVSGILVDPLLVALHRAGIDYAFTFLPEKRSFKLLNDGKVDARMESSKWVDKPARYLWTHPFLQLEDVLVFNRHSEFPFTGDKDLEGAHLVTHIGYGYPTLEALFISGQARREDRSTEREMLASLQRATPKAKWAAVMNKYVARWLIAGEAKYQGLFTMSERVVDSAPLQFQLRDTPLNRQRLEMINRELVKLEQQGEIGRLIEGMLSEADSSAK